jgi:hypothetical protein
MTNMDILDILNQCREDPTLKAVCHSSDVWNMLILRDFHHLYRGHHPQKKYVSLFLKKIATFFKMEGDRSGDGSEKFHFYSLAFNALGVSTTSQFVELWGNRIGRQLADMIDYSSIESILRPFD